MRQIQFGASGFIVLGVLFGLGSSSRLKGALSAHPPITFSLLPAALFMMIFATGRGAPLEFVYLFTFFAALLLAFFTWTGPREAGVFFSWSTAACCLLVIAAALIIFGLPNNRWIGGIHPNLMGFVLVVVGTYAWCVKNFVGKIIFALCIVLLILISSRYSLLTLLAIAVTSFSVSVFRRAGTIPALAVTVSIPVLVGLMWPLLEFAFVLNDRNRGFGSGGSGRAVLNELAFRDILGHLYTGAGFRNRAGYFNAHNGYINFLSENGLIVSALFAVTILYGALLAFREIFSENGNSEPSLRPIPYLYLGSLLAAAFQPQLVSLGDTQGMALIFGLGYLISRPSLVWSRPRGKSGSTMATRVSRESQ